MPSHPSTPPKSAGSARDDERAEKTTEILKKIRTLEIKTRGLVETAFAGNYHSVFKGRGMNFEDVREYQPGDEIRAIDWNVTARMGSAFVKKFTEDSKQRQGGPVTVHRPRRAFHSAEEGSFAHAAYHSRNSVLRTTGSWHRARTGT